MSENQDRKKTVVKELVQLAQKNPIVGIVNIEGLPTPQMQTMRAKLRGNVTLVVTKKRLIRIALKELNAGKEGIEKLDDYMRGMPAMIFTSENPFSLFKTLQKNKSSAPAKAGQTAPNDIVIPAGPTPFAPGPVIGELGAIGVKSGVEGGKVAVKEDTVVAKDGDTISAPLAAMLSRLSIEPMEVGLDLLAVFEDGTIFDKKILSVDETEYIDNITQGHRWAFNLAVEAGITTPETTELLVTNAQRDSLALATECAILTEKTTDMILGKASAQAQALKAITE